MAFQLEPKSDALFFERKQHTPSERADDVHKDLFDTISEAHYLPELGGPHDEALLESLVEKGCEDNQILGQALDKLAHLVTGDYEEEEAMLLSSAPVSEIIDRLEQSLESPERSSMTAAEGLLHLHQLSEHLPPDHSQHDAQPYLPEDMFAPQPDQAAMQPMPQPEHSEVDHQYEQSPAATLQDIQYEQNAQVGQDDLRAHYEQNAEAGLENDGAENSQGMYSDISDDNISNSHDVFEKTFKVHPPPDAVPAQLENHVGEGEPSHEPDAENMENMVEIKTEIESSEQESLMIETVDFKELEDDPTDGVELVATDLSINSLKPKQHKTKNLVVPSVDEIANNVMDSVSEKIEELPRDFSLHRRLLTPHASPRRTDAPRAPSRESDAMQSPQPSGIPAVPSSPEIFSMPPTKSKQTLFLESLLSSPSPKMYTSEVMITKQTSEPINLGKNRKSASPTVSSCTDEIRKPNKDFGEPQEKKSKHESTKDLAKISKLLDKSNEEQIPDSAKQKKPDPPQKRNDDISPLKQLQILTANPNLSIPDPLLVPKEKLNRLFAAPGREIPALMLERPELRLPDAFEHPAVLQDPDLLVITLAQLESILGNDAKKLALEASEMCRQAALQKLVNAEQRTTSQGDPANQSKLVPSMNGLAGDIDSTALNQMLWLPYMSRLEAMANCSQNTDFLKALHASGYTGPNLPDVSQMFNSNAAGSRGFANPPGFPPMTPPMDYDNRLQFAMWQEAMNRANATALAQKAKLSPVEAQMKELTKSNDVQNPFVHSTKSHPSLQNKPHSAARTSPITHNYNANQRAMPHNPYLQGMYPGMGPNMRPNMPNMPNMPLPGLQIPYFNPNVMSQRSPRMPCQKSPTSPYYQNNNYLPSKHPDTHQRKPQRRSSTSSKNKRRSSTSSQESPRPRITVKSLHNLLEPASAAPASAAPATSARRHSHNSHSNQNGVGQTAPAASHHHGPPPGLGRRRDEAEVGSTTPLGEPVMLPNLPQHHMPLPHHMPPHDPSSFHLWHPLFSNQKSYASPWNWTTVTATGD